MGDDEAFDGLVPVAVFVEAGVSLDRADDAIRGGGDGFGLFHDEFERATGACGTFAEQIEGVSVAVEDAAIVELEVVGNGGRPLPVEEGLVDGVAVGVIADGAERLVMGETDAGSLAGRGVRVRVARRAAKIVVARFGAVAFRAAG